MKTLKRLILECKWAAKREGAVNWERLDLTQADCDWIVGELGRKPSRDEWFDAGYEYVGSRHISTDYDEDDSDAR